MPNQRDNRSALKVIDNQDCIQENQKRSRGDGYRGATDDFNSDSDSESDGEYLVPLDEASDEENNSNENEYCSSLVAIEEKVVEVNGNGDSKKEKSKSRNQISSGQKKKQKQKQKQRRRRSSSRFLRLSGKFDSEDEGTALNQSTDATNLDLEKMFRETIRMNAENRINASNSWKFRLIDNLDKFLDDDDDSAATKKNFHSGSSGKSSRNAIKSGKGKRVNFTKASCTLDASVKIYSYRVDDVYLSSYKVLANLNRTDVDTIGEDGNLVKSVKTSLVGERKQSERRGGAETLETCVDNINISKLEQDYDIDPLFHKMSKTFDEGGAKGLLLVNLGVSTEGCNIVFDSKEASLDALPNKETVDKKDTCESSAGNIDISTLTSKLKTLLDGVSLSSLAIAPQLETLRSEYSQLKMEGFVNETQVSTLKHYGNTAEEEKEAEESIHHYALECSRASSFGNLSFATSFGNLTSNTCESFVSSPKIDSGDYAGGEGDDVFDKDFIDAYGDNDNQNSFSLNKQNFADVSTVVDFTGKSASANLLNFVCDDDVMIRGEYDYFNFSALKSSSTCNKWAGFTHWKKIKKFCSNINASREDISNTKKKSLKIDSEKLSMLDLWSTSSHLESKLEPPPLRRGGADPLLLSKRIVEKLAGIDNSLPLDAEVGVEHLSRLFVRPNASIKPIEDHTVSNHNKTVGFHDIQPSSDMIFDEGFDFCYGDDVGSELPLSSPNDFTEIDNFEIKALDGIRKVEKIEVGYVTVAKKVDVRRLKKDLWESIESKTDSESHDHGTKLSTECDMNEEMKEPHSHESAVSKSPVAVSFKETVNFLEASQSQGDVTLPFYFICILHLANEKCLKLDSSGCELSDFFISQNNDSYTE